MGPKVRFWSAVFKFVALKPTWTELCGTVLLVRALDSFLGEVRRMGPNLRAKLAGVAGIEKSSRGTEKGPCMSKATQNAKLQVYFGSDYVMN